MALRSRPDVDQNTINTFNPVRNHGIYLVQKKVVRKHEIWYTLTWYIINFRLIYYIILITKRHGNKIMEKGTENRPLFPKEPESRRQVTGSTFLYIAGSFL